ncbi:hypothetical protein KKE06_05805 [Candidatus Micrarchaeota archaeon]|nr:hypothetical protein [Candidatus Micrarchaeota archaeon]MBU1930509.1 hypothetical protein [Candidatus Micrarchaeota archaeon]
MMETLKVQLPKEKAQKVRETAMKRFGYSKGSISKALGEALGDWVRKNDAKKEQKAPNLGILRGVLKDLKMSSVELQHKAFLLKKRH